MMLWLLGLASAAVLGVYLAWFAHVTQMDFQVYRMGGQHVFGSGLYSSEITRLGRHLLFTYPPFSAALFWPLSHVSVYAGQTIWNAINWVALTTLIAVSIAAARSRSLVRSDWRTALILLTPVSFLFYPLWSDLALGQINIVLVLMIVADLTIGVSWRGRPLPQGVLVGIAAAIKLTPLVFIPYLVVSRQWHAAKNATLTFVLCTGTMWAVSPHASWVYFSKDAFDVSRVGNIELVGDQSLRAAILRAHVSLSPALLDFIGAVLLCAGIVVAVAAYRRSSSLLGVLVCAATGLMISPISWVHHYVWIVPVMTWLFVGVDRPARSEWWAAVAALAFFLNRPTLRGGSGLSLYLCDNPYVALTLMFIALIGLMLWTRSRARRQAFAVP
jgi:alpha-1,2-mannosyltransferase